MQERKETIAKLRVKLEEKKTKEVEKVEEIKENISKIPKEETPKETTFYINSDNKLSPF